MRCGEIQMKSEGRQNWRWDSYVWRHSLSPKCIECDPRLSDLLVPELEPESVLDTKAEYVAKITRNPSRVSKQDKITSRSSIVRAVLDNSPYPTILREPRGRSASLCCPPARPRALQRFPRPCPGLQVRIAQKAEVNIIRDPQLTTGCSRT